jgi:hypothetical protein
MRAKRLPADMTALAGLALGNGIADLMHSGD